MATLQERRLGYHSRAGLEPGTSSFSTPRIDHCAARGVLKAGSSGTEGLSDSDSEFSAAGCCGAMRGGLALLDGGAIRGAWHRAYSGVPALGLQSLSDSGSEFTGTELRDGAGPSGALLRGRQGSLSGAAITATQLP